MGSAPRPATAGQPGPALLPLLAAALWLLTFLYVGACGWERMVAETRAELVGVEVDR